MEKSPWMLVDRKLQAAQFVAANMDFSPENFGTSLPDSAEDGQIFTLVDSLTAPIYIWTFRYNSKSISMYKWEFIGGAFATVFGIDSDASLDTLMSTGLVNGANDLVYYKAGNAFSLPCAGEYEFTGGVMMNVVEKGIRVSTQMVFDNLITLSIFWPFVLDKGFNYVPLPLKRFNGLRSGKIALGIGSNAPTDITIRWSTCVIRPIRIMKGLSL